QLVPPPALDPKTARLAAAAEQVLAELHPAAADRVTIFVDLAGQAARERAAGKPASYRPDQLLATAVSGWVRGKNGASTDPDAAAKAWAAREAVLAYQRGINTNDRQAVLREYQRAYPLGLDELATVISMLPPAEPEDLAARTGTAVRPGPGVPEGVYRRKTGPHNQHPAGVEYLVKLPPEYHHGRAYPVLVVMGYAGIDPEKMVGALATEADRHGYVVVAPVWAPAFGPQTRWTYDPDDHDFVTGPLRDVVRHFAVDNDRVFLLGFGGGADAALDVGASHPDLFAGVIPVCPNPRWQGLFIEYWRNAQKLPVYAVTGQMALEGNVNIRRVFERWMPNGFPAVQVIYKGRGIEWFPAEVPVMFDWMGRKKRANGTATLQLGAGARQRWQTIRASDDRFYWLGADAIDPKNLAVNYPPGRTVTPAQLDGDIRNGNLITVRAQGVRRVSVWLGKEMIDWAQPVRVSLNGQPLAGWKPRVLEPDMGVLLEDYYRRGDRRMLYLARIEFPNAN
ncbi:MAG: hypothetical protein K2X82_28840, partial [Gemmataceae bacterium]|nr:hypothetical protein [Gemmataceae bacterium]